jgi:alpha-beta hydrolase superfamily lysophospholipase
MPLSLGINRIRGEDVKMIKPQVLSPWLSNMLAHVALASGVGYVAAAYSVSRWLTRPTPKRPVVTPDYFGLPWERLSCRTADGVQLVGWVVEPLSKYGQAVAARGTVALFHGMRFNREQTLDRTRMLAEAGYRCIAFDHRAHGESSGRRTSFGFHERQDVTAVLDLIRQHWPHQPRAALGMSMGAAALCYAASAAREWNAVILESCYHDIGSAFTSRLRRDYPAWAQRLTRGVIWLTERRLGVRLPQLAPFEYVSQLAPTPVLILTGMDDPHATPAEAKHLYECCREPREFWLVPDAAHRDVFEKAGPSYHERILGFLSRWL